MKNKAFQLIKTSTAIDRTKIYRFIVLKTLHPGQEIEWDTAEDVAILLPEKMTIS